MELFLITTLPVEPPYKHIRCQASFADALSHVIGVYYLTSVVRELLKLRSHIYLYTM